ncbi:MAG: YihY/virulence factor BrkB family protein [Thermodesulfovibrionales bacterium]|nr:YihY/virulence factor BrkB family protein [Thermodesulfovibrionales bacterium]
MKVTVQYLKAIAKGFLDFFRDGCPILAGSLTFFSIMAFIPFCLLILTLFNYILGANGEFARFFISKLNKLFPDITYEFIERISKSLSARGIEGLTVPLYAFQSYQLFVCLEFAMKAIFKNESLRNLFSSVVLSLLLVTLIIVLIFIYFIATTVMTMLLYYQNLLPFIEISKVTGLLIGIFLPLVLVFFSITFVYLMIPKQKIEFKNAFFGAFVATLLFEIAKYIFTVLIVKVLNLGVIYGSLSATIIFSLWIYYSWSIFLLGAETVKVLEKENTP